MSWSRNPIAMRTSHAWLIKGGVKENFDGAKSCLFSLLPYDAYENWFALRNFTSFSGHVFAPLRVETEERGLTLGQGTSDPYGAYRTDQVTTHALLREEIFVAGSGRNLHPRGYRILGSDLFFYLGSFRSDPFESCPRSCRIPTHYPVDLWCSKGICVGQGASVCR